MNKNDISKRVLSIIEEVFCLGMDVNPNDSLKQDLFFDWIDIFDAVTNIEDEFAITFSDDVVDKLETVQDIIDYVYDKLNQ